MKKKILGIIAVFAVVALAAFNVNVNVNNTNIPSFALTNIEALANTESDDEYCSMDTKVWYCIACYGYACYCE